MARQAAKAVDWQLLQTAGSAKEAGEAGTEQGAVPEPAWQQAEELAAEAAFGGSPTNESSSPGAMPVAIAACTAGIPTAGTGARVCAAEGCGKTSGLLRCSG